MTSRLGRLLGLDRRNHVRTPTILQMELTECGPAALAIILAYFGRRVSLEELRVACGVSRDGSKASSIVRAARRYGLDAEGHRLELDEVLAGPFPVIVIGASTISSCSRASRIPASSSTTRRPVRAAFPRGIRQKLHGRRPALCARSGLQARRCVGRAAGPAGPPPVGLPCRHRHHRLAEPRCCVNPGLVLPGATKAFVDDILVKRFDGWLSPLLVGLAAVFVLQIALSAVQQMALVRLELKLALEDSARFTWHVLRLPVEFFNQRFAGDLANRMDSNDRVARLLARDCGQAAATCFTASFLGIVMLFYDPTLAAIAILGAPSMSGC